MLSKQEIAEMVDLENKLLKKDSTPRKDADPTPLDRLAVLTKQWESQVEQSAGIPKPSKKEKEIIFTQRENLELHLLFDQLYAEDEKGKIKRKDQLNPIVPEDREWFSVATKRYDYLLDRKAKCDKEEEPLDPETEDVTQVVVAGKPRLVRKVKNERSDSGSKNRENK